MSDFRPYRPEDPSGRPFDGDSFGDWKGNLSDAELQLQSDLSCLVDDELDEVAAARVMVQMEESPECRAFFEDARTYARLHRDMADPERLEAKLATLSGLPDVGSVRAEAERAELIHRLATIFYQLGKAYILAGADLDGFQERVFEAAVKVDDERARGLGFVDGVLRGGGVSDAACTVQLRSARSVLESRLERIENPSDKGRKLLVQALEVDPTHEEAKIYLAFQLARDDKRLQAAELYREVFTTAMSIENRAHAANQLGRLHNEEEDWRRAVACWRWITMNGVVRSDERFWFAYLNIAISYTYAGDLDRALGYFRRLLDLHPDRATDIARVLADTPKLRSAIESQPEFPAALLERCPELFREPAELEA